MEIEAQAGKQFDPMVVDAFLELIRRGALAVPGVEDRRASDPRAPWDTAAL